MDEIEPWTSKAGPSQSWFGLTSGRYWVETSVGTALQHTEVGRVQRNLTSPYADYHVARFFEDLQNVLSAVLEPVPSDIAALTANSEWRAAIALHKSSEPGNSNYTYDIGEAFEWRRERSIDSGHLASGPHFNFCRIADAVHVDWETPGDNTKEIWLTPAGKFTISADNFKIAAERFIYGFLNAMQKRVDDIARNGWQRPDCNLDVPALIREQRKRVLRAHDLLLTTCKTDWPEIRILIRELSTSARIIDPLDYEGTVQ